MVDLEPRAPVGLAFRGDIFDADPPAHGDQGHLPVGRERSRGTLIHMAPGTRGMTHKQVY